MVPVQHWTDLPDAFQEAKLLRLEVGEAGSPLIE
jgi:hypothetical protein